MLSPEYTKIEPRSIALDLPPEQVAAGLRQLPGMVFLDSSSADSLSERDIDDSNTGASVSIVAARPVDLLRGNINHDHSRQQLRSVLTANRPSSISGQPDLGVPLGGLIGWIEYDGDFLFGQYPEMLIYNHSTRRWIETGRLSGLINYEAVLASYDGSLSLDFTDSSDRVDFCQRVAKAVQYIAAGDIYQVNLSHRFSAPWLEGMDSFSVYRELRHISSAPFSAYLTLGDREVLSASPEQFLRISDRMIETRPIKGTRPRFRDREKDEKSAYDLITSPKEIAELTMITDLERNDLGKVCEFGSVQVTGLLKLERFAQVFHLVSTVQGQLREEVDHIDALHACFPGGSITGAPKKRAREIIAELEPFPRGLYTGCVGCFGFNQESLFNIVIRTAVVESGQFQFHVGAGIVADSNPLAEWQETLHKAAGLLLTAGEKSSES